LLDLESLLQDDEFFTQV